MLGATVVLAWLVLIMSYNDSGVDFINGYFFLQRFYSVFDTTNFRVGFATTAYTNATSN
ncbi:hypothetical protein K503DRAFT_765642 [Rhizopogon vinicolor AM-OR11-026]|uniref:Peptidase A1 domain-containing protein n=1 Tax=Rhizopogon vinicolor AM-OR11-026 TaxID=1314800 RepID=A0A1B7NFI7_9AGAM|nr:hypothetical protein K503DRAFT_765642 [Rhizopogon vinicolor AM-OR11-026]